MNVDHRRSLTMLICGVAAHVMALSVAAVAAADPEPAPSPVLPVNVQAAPLPALPPSPAAPVLPTAPVLPAAPGLPGLPGPENPNAAPVMAGAPQGVPHLASPDSLPPGSTMDPGARGDGNPNVSYARDLWQAVQNHEISGKQALVLGLAQRGMNSPIPAQAPGPNVPTSPGNSGLAPAPGPTAPSPSLPPLGAPPGPVPAPAIAPAMP